jgi:cytoskeleton protein RodZ
VAERKDRDPGFGRLDDLDEPAVLPLGLRSARPRSDDESGPVDWPADSAADGLRADPPEDAAAPAIASVTGLTTRTHPAVIDADAPAAGQPGSAMRLARERLGMDTLALATRTRLPRRVIEDLEANRFDAVPPAYVRGYLRTVARELDCNADRWIQAYEDLGYTEPVLRATVQRNASGRWGLSRGVWALTVSAILVSALGLGVYSWTDAQHANPFAGLGDWVAGVQERFARTAPEPEPMVTESEPPAMADDMIAELEWMPEPAALDTIADSLPSDTEAGADALALQSGPGLPAVDLPPEGTFPEEAAAAATATMPSTAIGAAEAAPEPAAPLRAGASRLTLSFEAASWVEIRSPSDEVMLRGVFHAGDDRSIVVQMPARVVLGNAPGVRLSRDGAVVELSSHTREDRTARFTLGAD